MNADRVRQDILGWVRMLPLADFEVTPKERGCVIGLINDAVRLGQSPKEASLRRYKVLAWIFREYLGQDSITLLSSKSLPAECWWALWMYTEVRHDDETGKPVAGHGSFTDAMVSCWQAMEAWEADLLSCFGLED